MYWDPGDQGQKQVKGGPFASLRKMWSGVRWCPEYLVLRLVGPEE